MMPGQRDHHGSTSELESLGHAARNASFIGRTCLGAANETGFGFDRFEEGLPFGIIVDAEVKAGSGETSITLAELIRDLAEPRSSFGFLETTCTTFTLEETAVTRIFAGQATQAQLIEGFFGLGRMLARDRMLESVWMLANQSVRFRLQPSIELRAVRAWSSDHPI
jgi:hypothetical protein